MNTIIPWILGGLILLFLIGIVLTIRFWRESKVSPYYFLRRQAEQRMHTYSLGTVGTAVLLIFFVSYANQPTQSSELRMVALSNTKPSAALVTNQPLTQDENQIVEAISESDEDSAVVALSGSNGSEISADLIQQSSSSLEAADNILSLDELASVTESEAEEEEVIGLPPEYDRLTPSVDIYDATSITQVSFSNEIDNNTSPVAPRRLFDESLETIYATFDYDEMADGMVWSWVWKRNGQVIGGGNQAWEYGQDGPGYIYLSPTEGFLSGEYTVEIWVNGQLMADANMIVTNDLATSR